MYQKNPQRDVTNERQSLPPLQRYRVEGIGKRGVLRYAKIAGRPGSWRIQGADALDFEVRGETVEEAVRLAKRRLPFRPVTIRPYIPPPSV